MGSASHDHKEERQLQESTRTSVVRAACWPSHARRKRVGCPAHCVFDGTSKVARPVTPDQDHRSLGVDVAINIIADPDWDEDRLAAATRKLLRAGLGR